MGAAGSLQAKPDCVFVTHGEDKVTEILQKNCGVIPLPGDGSVLGTMLT